MKTPAFSINSNKEGTLASTNNSGANPRGPQLASRLSINKKGTESVSAFELQMQANLARERRFYEEMVGIAEDKSVVNLEDFKKQIWKAESKLKDFKNFAKSKSLAHAKKII